MSNPIITFTEQVKAGDVATAVSGFVVSDDEQQLVIETICNLWGTSIRGTASLLGVPSKTFEKWKHGTVLMRPVHHRQIALLMLIYLTEEDLFWQLKVQCWDRGKPAG